MSGRRIDDHKFFAGEGSPKFPMGVHHKEERSADSAGHLAMYEDHTEAIKAAQEMAEKKIKKHAREDYHRY